MPTVAPSLSPVSFTTSGPAPSTTYVQSIRMGHTEEKGMHVYLAAGTGVGTVQLERSFDQGETWIPYFAAGQQLYVWNYTGSAISEDFSEAVDGTLYRLNCTAYTSGTINGGIAS
jgi:hypothetical protein